MTTTVAALPGGGREDKTNVGPTPVFLAFRLGIRTPLLGLAVVPGAAGRRPIRALARHHRAINAGTSLVMLAVSVYYLTRVFDVFGVGTALGVA